MYIFAVIEDGVYLMYILMGVTLDSTLNVIDWL
jgi:hypothetical protein